MPQAQRSLRQTIAIRKAIAARKAAAAPIVAAPAPAAARIEDTYTILTPIKTWKSSRSRKRVVKRVQNPTQFQYGFQMPALGDILMLLDHNAYAVVGTVSGCNAPVLGDGDLYVSHATGEIIAMGRAPRSSTGNHTILIPTGIVRERVDIALRPVATDLAKARSALFAKAAQESNVIRARFPR